MNFINIPHSDDTPKPQTQPTQPAIPKITTRETDRLRDQYPNLSHLEAGLVAEWLQERKDQLFEQARGVENAADTTRVLSLAAASIGTVCYAVNPFMLVGGMIGGAAWLWFVVEHYTRTKEIAPLPFVRGNFLDAMSRAGDYDARNSYQVNHQANTIKFLRRHDAEEYVFLYSENNFELITQYLSQVEPGKRFYAYRWLLGWFAKLKGKSLPTIESLADHLKDVAVDSRVRTEEVSAITQINSQRTERLTKLPQTPTVDIRTLRNEMNFEKLPQVDEAFNSAVPPQWNPIDNSPISTSVAETNLENIKKLPIQNRAETIANLLIKDGFKIDDMMGSQVIAIAGTQRGGKGTLAGILTILSKALDPSLKVEYFTAGVDVYPFACSLHSALKFPPNKHGDVADKAIALELFNFLKQLEGSAPYSHKNLVLIIDEAMRLLSLLDKDDRIWAIQFLLSRFAKTGGTLIIVLHGSNLSSVVGKETTGLADTFKQSVAFIGCVAKAVNAGGLRKMNVASGEYFKANPDNFGNAITGGELGAIPEWLKTEKHPGNGYPDPVRTLLTFFPELIANHTPLDGESNDYIVRAVVNDDRESLQKSFNHLLAPNFEVNDTSAPIDDAEADDASAPIDDALVKKVLELICKASNPPISFNAIRTSKCWTRDWLRKQPGRPQLRGAIEILTQNEQIVGNETEGYSSINKN